jgi:MFS family permease
VVLIFAVTVTGIMANTVILAAVPDILDDFGQPASRAGLLIAAGALPGIVMAPLLGAAADRVGRRRVLVPCLVVFGVAGGLAALAPSFWVLVVLRLLQGAGSAGLINLAVVVIGDHWGGVDRARMIGRNSAVLTVAIAVLPGIGGLLTEVGSWRTAFALYPIALVTAVAVQRLLPEVPLEVHESTRRQLRDAGDVLVQPVVAGAIAIGFVVFALIFGLFLTSMPVLLEGAFDLRAGARGVLLAAPALVAAVVAFNLGRLSARFGRRRLLIAAIAAFAVAFVTIGLAGSLVVLVGAAFLYGAGEGAMIPSLQDVVVGESPTESRGAVLAVFVSGARAGQTVGPLLAGIGIGVIGAAATFVVGGAVAAALAVLLLVLAPRVAATGDRDGVGTGGR